METREEHLRFCKERALEYVDAGEPLDLAYRSLASDLRKHPETARHAAIELGFMLLLAGHLNTPEEMREFIEGCR